MKEQEVPEQLAAYSESLGRCSQFPVRRTTRPMALVPGLAAAAVCVAGVFLWPRDASAETLHRLDMAIRNAKTMDATTYMQTKSGQKIVGLRLSSDSGMWRLEWHPIATKPQILIYRDGLCYQDFEELDHMTLRPITLPIPIPVAGGNALDVVKEQLTQYFMHRSVMRIESATDVGGRPAYKVKLDNDLRGRRVEILVDKETDLPISAEAWSDDSRNLRTHWDYHFNVKLPDHFFEPPAGRPIVDLRKTVPAQLALWKKPIASFGNFHVLDACVTADGTVWIVAKPQSALLPSNCVGLPTVPYAFAEAQDWQVKLSKDPVLEIFGFSPMQSIAGLPKRCSIELHEYIRGGEPVGDPDSGSVTAGQIKGTVATLSFPLRRENAGLPKYVDGLGLDEEVFNLDFSRDMARMHGAEAHGQFAVAAKLYEKFARDCTPEFDAYYEHMKHAEQDYRKAGMPEKARQLEAEAEKAKASGGSVP